MPTDLVECRSDHDYIGYPLAFFWQGQQLEVSEILAEGQTPQGYIFRVRNQDFGIFELSYDKNADQWSVHQR